MGDIKQYSVVKEKETGVLWVIMEKKNLCYCHLEPVNLEGSWVACLDKDCRYNELKVIEFMS